MIKICISKTRTHFVSKKGEKRVKEEGNGFALTCMPDMIMSLFAPRPIEELHRRLAASQASTLIVVVRGSTAGGRLEVVCVVVVVTTSSMTRAVTRGQGIGSRRLPNLAIGMSLTWLEAVKRWRLSAQAPLGSV